MLCRTRRHHVVPSMCRSKCVAEPLERRVLLAQVLWTGSGDGVNWTNPSNWSSDPSLPGPNDDVIIDVAANPTVSISSGIHEINSLSSAENLTINGGSLSIANSSTIGGNFLLSSGTLTGSGDVSVTGLTNAWTGGTMSGSGKTVISGLATIHISGAATKHLQRQLEINAATANWTGGDIHCNNGRIAIASGLFNASGNGTVVNAGGQNFFSNGISNFNQIADTTRIEIPFDHTSTASTEMTVNGTLVLAGGGQSRGKMNVSGLLVIENGVFEVLGAGAIFGSGTARFAGGSHFISGTNPLAPNCLEVVGAGALLRTSSFVPNVLQLQDGATLRALTSQNRVKELDIDATSTLDLAGQSLVINYDVGSPLNQIRTQLTSGYAAGAWNGSGINSSVAAVTPGHAVGYAESSAIFSEFPATFAGQQVDDTAVLLRYTRYGDADLDQQVNLSDFNRLAGGFGSGSLWSQGNFNYDSTVNLADFNLLASNFGLPAGAEDGRLALSRGIFEQLRELVLL